MSNRFKSLIQSLGFLVLLSATGCGDMLGERDQPSVGEGCEVGGCSSEVCIEEGTLYGTDCQYEESFACYKTATCERQASGACGWTATEELQSCLGE